MRPAAPRREGTATASIVGQSAVPMRAVRHAALCLAAVLAATLVPAAQTPPFDLLIRGARVVDGTGSPWYRADVAVRGDSIAAIAPSLDAPAARVVEAAGLVLAPGFIDLHVHAFQASGPAPKVLFMAEAPAAENYIRQGVTTLIAGPDGFAPVPLAPALDGLLALGIGPNLGTLVGHGSVREAVLGNVNRAPTPDELDRMRGLVRQGMRDGAFGLSTGLFYVPATYSATPEVIELARVAGAMGGIHVSHIRDEVGGLVDSVRETIEIGERGGLPTQVTHHKAIGRSAWGKTVETLRLIDEARRRGVDATIDVYPYTASSTTIQAALLPPWAQEGTPAEIVARITDPAIRPKVLAETIHLLREERGAGDPHNVQLSRCDWQPDLAGRHLDEVTRSRGLTPTIEHAAETVLWLVAQGGCGGIYYAIDEQDVQRVLAHPATMVASDGQVVVYGRASPHPRAYGTFVRVLGRYVRELQTLTLEEAVRKMTAFPAQRIGLADRGVIKVGMKADLVLFDPETVRDTATFERPHQYAEGVSRVFVNGIAAYEDGRMTGARPGRILYGPGRAR